MTQITIDLDDASGTLRAVRNMLSEILGEDSPAAPVAIGETRPRPNGNGNGDDGVALSDDNSAEGGDATGQGNTSQDASANTDGEQDDPRISCTSSSQSFAFGFNAPR